MRSISSDLVRKAAPSNGMSPRIGTCVLPTESRSWIIPPSATASPSETVTVVLTRRCWMVGESMPELVVRATFDTSCSMSSRTRPLSLTRGVTERITPVSRIWTVFTIGASGFITERAVWVTMGTSSPTCNTAVRLSITVKVGAETTLTLVMPATASSTTLTLLTDRK